MIVVASGHQGVDGYVKDRPKSDEVIIARHWNEVLDAKDQMDALFLGRDLPGLPSPQVVSQALPSVETVIWVDEQEARTWSEAAAEQWQIWAGSLDQGQLDSWLDRSRRSKMRLESCWAVAAVSGQMSREATVGWLVEMSLAQGGQGVLVDLDWNDPQTTWHSPWGRPGSDLTGYEHLAAVRMPYGVFVPAPPPWMMLLARPGREELQRLRMHYPEHWLGFDMGSDLRNPLWTTVADMVERVYLVCPGRPWAKALADVISLFEDLRSELRLTLLTRSGDHGEWLQAFRSETRQVLAIGDHGSVAASLCEVTSKPQKRNSRSVFSRIAKVWRKTT